jgi:hypothetical protein
MVAEEAAQSRRQTAGDGDRMMPVSLPPSAAGAKLAALRKQTKSARM